MTVQTTPVSGAAAWETLFPVTSAWLAAYGQAGALWLSAVDQTARACTDLAKSNADLLCGAMTYGMAPPGAGGLANELAEAALHAAEDIGLGDREFIPLPE